MRQRIREQLQANAVMRDNTTGFSSGRVSGAKEAYFTHAIPLAYPAVATRFSPSHRRSNVSLAATINSGPGTFVMQITRYPSTFAGEMLLARIQPAMQ